MKVLLIGPHPPPESGTSIPLQIFHDFITKQRGIDVDLVNTQSGDKTVESFLKFSVLKKIVNMFFKILIKAFSADKILIFGSERFISTLGAFVIALFSPLGKEVSIRIYGGSYDVYYKNLGTFRRVLIRRVFGLCSRIVVETKLMASSLRSVWPKQLYVAANYRYRIDKGVGRVKSDGIRFIYSGIVRKKKGVSEIIEAFFELKSSLKAKKSNLRVTLDIFGPIYDAPDDFIDLTYARNDPDIFLHGHVVHDTLVNAYLESDVFVFPSYWPSEGHSGSLIEAMMCGLAVITSDWMALPEIVTHEVDGLLCKAKDVKSLAECMERLTLNPSLRLKLGEKAYETSKRFEVSLVCKELAKALNLVID